MDTAAKTQATTEKQREEARPTIALERVMLTLDAGSFSGWGPKVPGLPNALKNWN